MTDTHETPAPAAQEVVISPRMREAIEHMLENVRGMHYVTGVAQAIGVYPGTLSPILRRMVAAGWLENVQPTPKPQGSPGKQGRIYYRFTTGTAPMLRRALR